MLSAEQMKEFLNFFCSSFCAHELCIRLGRKKYLALADVHLLYVLLVLCITF